MFDQARLIKLRKCFKLGGRVSFLQNKIRMRAKQLLVNCYEFYIIENGIEHYIFKFIFLLLCIVFLFEKFTLENILHNCGDKKSSLKKTSRIY